MAPVCQCVVIDFYILRFAGAGRKLQREQTHTRRFDPLIKRLTFLITSLYWLNPFARDFCPLRPKDMEWPVDEQAIKRPDADRKDDDACLSASPKRISRQTRLPRNERNGPKVKCEFHLCSPRQAEPTTPPGGYGFSGTSSPCGTALCALSSCAGRDALSPPVLLLKSSHEGSASLKPPLLRRERTKL